MGERAKLVLAGGCGSSGTTLLANLLGRHPSIVAAPEFDVFNHAEALSLETLRAEIDALFGRRRLCHGFKLVASFLTPGSAVGIERATLERWLAEAVTIEDVYAKIAAHMCAARDARYFVEKTPTNVYTFRAFAERYAGIPLIHQIRDGRDVAASLMKRGKTLFYAGSRWLYDTAAGIAARGRPQYFETRYEALASDPAATLASVLAHLGLEYDVKMLAPASNGDASTYEERWREKRSAKAWRSTPKDPISAASVGRYRTALSADEQAMLLRIRLTERAAEELASPVRTFGELLEHLGYARDDVKPQSSGVGARLRELRAELAEHAYRTRRSIRYTGRIGEIVTTFGL
jgi:hypothetical protein